MAAANGARALAREDLQRCAWLFGVTFALQVALSVAVAASSGMPLPALAAYIDTMNRNVARRRPEFTEGGAAAPITVPLLVFGPSSLPQAARPNATVASRAIGAVDLRIGTSEFHAAIFNDAEGRIRGLTGA